MFGVTGAGMSKIKHMQNGGKRARRSLDQWDRVSIPSSDAIGAVSLTIDSKVRLKLDPFSWRTIRRNILTVWWSDGTRSQTHGHATRTNG